MRLGKVAEYVRGVTYKAGEDLSAELGKGYVTLLRANNIQNGKLVLDDVQYVDRAKVKPRQLLKKGDILICASSGSKRLVGKAAFVPEDMDVTFGAFCCVMRPCGINAEYLSYYFQSNAYRKAIEETSTGSNINNLKANDLTNLSIKGYGSNTGWICSLLHSACELLDSANRQLALLDDLVKSRFVEMFGTLEHPRYTIVELQDICAYIVDCPHETPKYDGMLEYPAIRTSELVGTTIDWSSMKYVSEEEYQRRTRRLIPQPGDIVYAREGTYGSAAILPDGYRFCLGQRTMLFRADASVCLPQYLLFAITSPDVKGQADLLNVGSTVPHVNVKDAKRFRIPLPSLALQREFADFATRVDKLRVEAQVQKEKLQTLYDSLAQDYFAI